MVDPRLAALAQQHALRGMAIPVIVRDLAGDHHPTLVWRNDRDGLTFWIEERYVKWNPRSTGIDLEHFGEGHQQELFDAYGIDPEAGRIS
jgi:hypothetical protein